MAATGGGAAEPLATQGEVVDVSFHAIDSLPDDAAAGMMLGVKAGHLYIRRGATADEVAEALTEIVTEWARDDWMYIGRAWEIA